jgi:plastocyanin
VNEDDSPHQITVLAFSSAGTYEYICGLHPNMKGAVEVK